MNLSGLLTQRITTFHTGDRLVHGSLRPSNGWLTRLRVHAVRPVPMDAPTVSETATNSPNRLSPIGVWLRLPFRIYKVQSDGDLHFVEATQTFDDARVRVRELGKLWPGEYGIENVETGERIFVSTRDERKN